LAVLLHHCGGAVRADVGVYPPLAEQAGLANREAILPSGEPLINIGPEKKFEFRYNTSPCRNFPKLSDLSPVRPPTHGAMRRALSCCTFKKKKNRQRKTGNKTGFVLTVLFREIYG